METVLNEVGQATINDYELVFIPIIWQKHYYLMCFNLKNVAVKVIDNSANEPNMALTKKYSGWVQKMVRRLTFIIE